MDINKGELNILLLGYKEGTYTYQEVFEIIFDKISKIHQLREALQEHCQDRRDGCYFKSNGEKYYCQYYKICKGKEG